MAAELPTGIRIHGDGLQIRVQHNGNVYSKTISANNPRAKAAIAEAVRERGDMLSRLKLGLPIYADEITTDPIFATVAQAYLETLDLKLSTVQGYTNILNKHWLPKFGTLPLSQIQPSTIKSATAKMKVTAKTKRNLIGPLSGVFDYAVAEQYMKSNPCGTVKIPRHQKALIERFTPTEKAAILAQLTAAISAPGADEALAREQLVYFTLFFETGLRPGEILGLRWTDYDGDTLHVERAVVRRRMTTTKTYEVRDVIVSDALRNALAEHPTKALKTFIFLNTFKAHHKDTDRFNPAWQAALAAAEVRYRIPYTCRHTRASELLTAGIEPAFAAKQMGHTLEMFFRTYADWIDEVRGNQQRAMIRGIGAQPRQD